MYRLPASGERRAALSALLLWGLLLGLAACQEGELSRATCGDVAEPADASLDANLFSNPSFEEGDSPWFSLSTEAWGTPFLVSESRAHSGKSSAYLQLRTEPAATKVFGVAQEIEPGRFPEVLSGYYYVDRWEKGTPKQYLQAAVIAIEATNMPVDVAPANSHQLRYILAGVERQPTFIENARYVMVTTEAPEVGQWVPFVFNICRDYQELWGAVPEGYSTIRILFEARWDERLPSDPPSLAAVYYDDLYVGPSPES